eukprot:845716-Prorocentrum_minimum.AAC.1
MPALPASHWSVVRIYLRFLRLIGPSNEEPVKTMTYYTFPPRQAGRARRVRSGWHFHPTVS